MEGLHIVKRLELPVREQPWDFAAENADRIASYFSELQATTPHLWNGGIFLTRNPRIEGDCFRADYFPTDYASYLAWRGWGFPDVSVFSAFGMGAIRSADGAFLLGEMAPTTANAGRVYFPAGTPDPLDVRDGALDMAAGIEREMIEEVGLLPTDYVAAPHWTCVFSGQRIALIRELHSPLKGDALRERVAATIAAQDDPELSAIYLVRSTADLTDAMPPFVAAYLRSAFG